MRLLIATLLLLASFNAFAQVVPPAPDDQAVVYFVRPSSLGALINFTFYDGENIIARFAGRKYFRYECAPGPHVFWAKAENRSYVEANLEAGKIYLIESLVNMGAIKARVQLQPHDPATGGIKQVTQKMMAKWPSQSYDPALLAQWSEIKTDATENGLERYNQLKAEEREVSRLDTNMYVTPEDFIFKKKKN